MRVRLVRPSLRGFRRAAPVPAALLAGLLAGCGTSSSSSGALKPEGSFETGAASAPSSAAAPSAQPTALLYKTVIDRYREYQAVYKRVYERNDPAELATVAADPLLTQVTKDVEATKAKGEIWRFANTFNPRVYGRSTDSTKVYVLDCVRTLSGYRFSARTGKRLGGGPGSAYVYRSTVLYDSGTWKVADIVQDRPC
ncbi:hypothetical protein [Actinomadura rubrisoli]|uniref:Nuclear transport factor 2 family protein n=1 Tax=Actinomadura rubrisoli TaxID=2530368 RepID=A0A4R5CBJ3_9ACTN|nr:hypothetical protein [Actinomadura rubrisoli]TDD95610.1 hypothetical protein E1298_04325 [Actinomadura rubrisoli]